MSLARPSNDNYFLGIAIAVSLRATCARRKVGCVLVNRHNFIVATAYNAVPACLPHCIEKPCPGAKAAPGTNLHLCIAQHAETLALIRCPAIYDIDTCYVTASPCIECTRRLIDTSCQRIVFIDEYPHMEAAALWKSLGRLWERNYDEFAAFVRTGGELESAKRTTTSRRRKAPSR